MRDTFRVRTNLVEVFRKKTVCGVGLDDQTHAMRCLAYADLREGLDMEKNAELVLFFRKVMESRMED